MSLSILFSTLFVGSMSYLIIYIIYQRFLHPLAKYPGPFLASLTDLWQVSEFLSLKQPYNLTALHEKYGQFVRYGPDKISTTAEDAIPIIYQKGGRMFPKTEFYDAYGSHIPNIFGMRDELKHSIRRRHMSYSFSASSVKKMESLLDENIKILNQKLRRYAESGEVVDLKKLFKFYTIDIIGELAFGRSFAVQETGDESRVPPVVEHSLLAAVTGAWPAMTFRLKRWLPKVPSRALRRLFEGRAAVAKLAATCVRERLAAVRDAKGFDDGAAAPQRKDLLTSLILAKDPDTGERLSQIDLEAEAFGFIIAGTHTTSATTSLLFYHLLEAPEIMAKCVAEIDFQLPPLDVDKPAYAVAEVEAALPFLRKCVKENFRDTPVFTMPLARRVLAPEGVTIGGEHIPFGTSIAVCNHAFHHNLVVWGDDHNTFDPDRWDQPDTAARGRFLMHFGLGGRQCIGKTLAQTNIYKLTSTLLREFAFDYARVDGGKAGNQGEKKDASLGRLPDMASVGISDLEHPLLVRVRRRVRTNAQLAKRVKDLEAELLSAYASSTRPLGPATEQSNSHDESAVDLLAATAFDESPKQDIGNFGPSSNHAIFKTTASVLTRTLPILCRSSGHNIALPSSSSLNQQESDVSKRLLEPSLRHRPMNPGPNNLFISSTDEYLNSLVSHFFETQGPVFPYVDKTLLGLNENHSILSLFQNTSNARRALLNIICAQAALSKSSPDAEVFYRRTLVLLDGLPLRGSSLQLVQALLLLCSFQQNTQRSLASWTYHAIAVKASFQMGLHAPTLYDEKDVRNCEILRRVWLGVIIQDSAFSMALGRPRLISPLYTRMPHNQVSLLNLNDNVVYFYQLGELTKVRASIMEAIEERHFGSSQNTTIHEILYQRLQQISKLEHWEKNLPPAMAMVTSAEMAIWSPPSYGDNRFRILLTIHYYITVLLINRPVLDWIAEYELGQDVFHPYTGEISIALGNDLTTAKELDSIISCIAKKCPGFFDHNAIWWTCNYYTFTAALHLFTILLASYFQSEAAVLHRLADPVEVRKAVVSSLRTLESIDRGSLMSQKGRHCLQRFLHVLETVAPHKASAPDDIGYNDPTLTSTFDDMVAQLIAQPAYDFTFQSSQLGFLDSDMDFPDPAFGGQQLF
ncbi:benzoate 4-monooxygenase [Alternaria panax]|uniref:Benzoate 4-monooxygenase n=1 Tax=Alternaria panax TaxID=48097 RepID=A0AAD4FF01_9PLEO|nr:benzoate 4-monooxygenase [Alternaria panax]